MARGVVAGVRRIDQDRLVTLDIHAPSKPTAFVAQIGM